MNWFPFILQSCKYMYHLVDLSMFDGFHLIAIIFLKAQSPVEAF